MKASEHPSDQPLIGSAATTQNVRGITVGFPATVPDDTERAMDKLEKLIKDRVGGDTWGDSGTALQSLEGRGEFVITQTEENHQKIDALLSEYRKAHDTLVCVQSRFVSLDANAIAKLPESLWKSLGSEEKLPCIYLSPDQLQSILTIASTDGGLISAPRVTLFDGGRCVVGVTRQTPCIASFVLPKGATAYVPQTQPVTSGIRLDLQPIVSTDRKYVTLIVDATLSTLDGFEESDFIAPDGSDPGEVQIPQMSIARLQSRVSVPDGATVLIADWHRTGSRPSSTRLGFIPSTQPAILNKDEPIYLLLTPQVVVQHEIEESSVPILSHKSP